MGGALSAMTSNRSATHPASISLPSSARRLVSCWRKCRSAIPHPPGSSFRRPHLPVRLRKCPVQRIDRPALHHQIARQIGLFEGHGFKFAAQRRTEPPFVGPDRLTAATDAHHDIAGIGVSGSLMCETASLILPHQTHACFAVLIVMPPMAIDATEAAGARPVAAPDSQAGPLPARAGAPTRARSPRSAG